MQSGVGVSYYGSQALAMDIRYCKRKCNTCSIFIMAAAFIANYFYKVSAIVLILICIALGVVLTLYREKKAKKKRP